jgi:SAM-dependent methyltransferase
MKGLTRGHGYVEVFWHHPHGPYGTKELIDLLRLPDGGRVLDVACGKAEFLCLVAERYEVTGTGLDLSPVTFEEARKNVAARQLTNRIDLLNMDGGKYELDRQKSLDMASCIGASWVYQGHKRTLEALKKMVRPGGLVLAGEPFWKIPPEPEYLELTEQEATIGTGTRDSSGRLPNGTWQPIPMIRTRRRSSIPYARTETATCGGGVTAWAGPCTCSVRLDGFD